MRSSQKKTVVPATPKAESDEEVPPTPVTETKKTPRKRAPAKQFTQLSSTLGAGPVDVSYENETIHGKALAKGAGFGQNIKLVAPQQFELVGSFMLENGLQAVIIKPSPPFPFLKLPRIVRTKIFQMILDPTTNKGKIEITTEGKSGGAKAKDYAKEFKHRTAIATLNKQLASGARMILYGYRLRFDNTTTLLNFLSMIGDEARKAMVTITITSYVKATAMPCMNLLAECRNLTKINILNGVGANSTPQKTAKSFFTEANRLLQTLVNTAGGNKDAAFSIIIFGKGCLTTKEEDEIVAWDDDESDDFVKQITDKLK
ncbi:hypothetical protein KCU62_g6028, partial [Aureobasidium sp. EXF-3399]